MCQIPIKMLKQHAIPKSSLQNLFLHQKGAKKLVKNEFMYEANTAILKLRIFRGKYHCRLWVFASTGKYVYY